MRTTIDPVTFAVVKHGLDAIVEEMAYTVLRTARSEIVKDVMDFSAAICDRDGRMIAQAKTIALHLGAVPEAMSVVLEHYADTLVEGDAIILNDPYQGGMHLPDIFMFMPIFYDCQLQAFTVVICHHTDVGGRVPGSNASDSTEIFQEGLRIPALKLFEGGQPNTTLMSLVEANVRLPDRVLGDLKAQYAACRTGGLELEKIFRRYGSVGAQHYFSELLDYAEHMTREEISTWPDGTYTFEDYVDDDGLSDTPLPIRVSVAVHGDSITVDYEGSSSQVQAALNSTKSYTNSCTYLSVRCALKSDIPNNAGVFRAITVNAPVASILNPVMPAACAARALTGYRVVDAMFGALAKIVPDRMPAAGEGGNTVVCLAGHRSDGSPFIIVDMICGAWGGRPTKDGIEGITNPSQNLSNTPIETLESQHPVRVEEYALVADSCGPGHWRGGVGLSRSYRVLAKEANLQLRADRMKFQPYGLNGGGEAPGSTNTLISVDGSVEALPSKINRRMVEGELIRHTQPGGGGFGDPMTRDPAQVAEDVWNEKVSAVYARDYHGVVVDPATGVVNETATASLRSMIVK